MQESRDVQEGKAPFAATALASMHLYPFSIRMHFEDSKPLFDMEGHATRLLEKVYITSPRGEMGEKALFMLASVAFYRERYKAADEYFFDLTQKFPNSPHYAKALELSIVCKQISTGGPDYDGRKLQEARDLIKQAERSCPELSKDQGQFLTKQKLIIFEQEAEHDYDIACFYDRTGHPGAAHFYYAIVTKRYHDTEWAAKAQKRMAELRATAQDARDGSPQLTPGPSDIRAPEPAPPPRTLPASLGSPGR
jgi:outer membrane protein assembly factor BamD (BamD/ComL family)